MLLGTSPLRRSDLDPQLVAVPHRGESARAFPIVFKRINLQLSFLCPIP